LKYSDSIHFFRFLNLLPHPDVVAAFGTRTRHIALDSLRAGTSAFVKLKFTVGEWNLRSSGNVRCFSAPFAQFRSRNFVWTLVFVLHK